MLKEQIYANVTAKILAGFEEAGSWARLWKSSNPRSLAGHEYTGINRLILNSSKYESNVWGSFKQITDWGGSVRKGEKGHYICFWKISKHEDKNTGLERKVFMERWYYVFNSDQADFDERGKARIIFQGAQCKDNKENVTAESIIRDLPFDIDIIHESGIRCPHYNLTQDHVKIYPMSEFNSSEDYYSVLFHELTHSTGHPSRLKRFDFGEYTQFGSETYSKEELVAEMGAAFLCAIAGIEGDLKSSMAYIQSWSRKLKENPDWLISAVSKAKKAVELIAPQEQYAEPEMEGIEA